MQYAVKFGPFISLLTICASGGRVVTSEDALNNGFCTYSLRMAELPLHLIQFLIVGARYAEQVLNSLSEKQSMLIKQRWACLQNRKTYDSC